MAVSRFRFDTPIELTSCRAQITVRVVISCWQIKGRISDYSESENVFFRLLGEHRLLGIEQNFRIVDYSVEQIFPHRLLGSPAYPFQS